MIRAIVSWPARTLGRRAEGATLAALDALLASRLGAEVVDRVLASDLAARAVSRVLEGPLVDAVARDLVRYAVVERLAEGLADDPQLERVLLRVLESRLVDEAVRRVLDGEELWLVVDEVAQSPAVTDAIARQSVSFADQVAGQVRARSRNADARLERAARRVMRRRSTPGAE